MTEETKYKVEKSPARPAVREAIRDEDPRERAARRAEQIRNQRGGLDSDGIDEFFVDPAIVPDGWSYEWKRHTFLGKEDPSYAVQVARGGWEPVPASRHPEMMPAGNYTIIERKGQILMERPLTLTNEARDIELRRARNQVRAKEAQLSATPDGTMTREHERVRPSVKKSFTPMEIPADQ